MNYEYSNDLIVLRLYEENVFDEQDEMIRTDFFVYNYAGDSQRVTFTISAIPKFDRRIIWETVSCVSAGSLTRPSVVRIQKKIIKP
jgi:hypothetical protein